MTSFITSTCSQRLGLHRYNSNYFIEGIGSKKVGVSKGKVDLQITSLRNDIEPFMIEALVLPKISSQLPQEMLDEGAIADLRELNLADPSFYRPGNIDILIGAEHYLSLLKSGHFEPSLSSLIAHETILGWVVSGTTTFDDSKLLVHCSSINVDESLQKFWEVEEIKTTPPKSPHDIYCENLFLKTIKQNNDGKFILQLPFSENAAPLGESKSMAIKRWYTIERRLMKDAVIRDQYLKFMEDYIQLGHMELIPTNEPIISNSKLFYLPHHSVLKVDSSTTKLRVVFDASAKSSSGRSLNDNLLVGPTIQQTLYQILLRFRFHKYVMAADIEKMYRQILIDERHTNFQRIVWRRHPDEPLQEYRLLTVTYGTSCAPFLATRTLSHLADIFEKKYPNAALIIKRDIYVDDLMTGTDTEAELINLKEKICHIMKSAHFNLRKWSTNSIKLLSRIPEEDREISPVLINPDQSYVKILGLFWNAQNDIFSYKVNLDKEPRLTKRGMLSEASRIFDPHGWLSPITVHVKILFQKLWMVPLQWDDELPEEVMNEWLKFRKEAHLIQRIEIPRWLQMTNKKLSLHGFADASKNAYAAVIYAITTTDDYSYNVNIVTAKTKVAPVKQISIAKLELCATVLLKNLMSSVLEVLQVTPRSIHLWTDSTIVLCWLSTIPRNLGIFEGNRVSQVIDSFPRKYWGHVTSSQNPADIASRGALPSQLLDYNLWWKGPDWLRLPETEWPKSSTASLGTDCTITCNITAPMISDSFFDTIINQNSNFNTILRKLAWCLRFIDKIKLKLTNKHSSDKQLNVLEFDKTLSVIELSAAKTCLVKFVQEKHFYDEIKKLKDNLQLNKNSKILSLNPFLDESEMLRVGGRICRSNVGYNTKHPMILPSSDPVTAILIRTMHEQYLHAGPTLLLNIIRQNYWILRCKNSIRSIIHKCVPCHRQRQSTLQPMMADLPKGRVTFVRPFMTTGIDYAGPIYIRTSRRRGAKMDKAYIVVFVCYSTKAIHVELAGDMTTETFIAALRRFVNRRGLCGDIYSDNGSNFVGAEKELRELFKILNDNSISSFLSRHNINWHFNPPAAPNFGGIFEAAVKSIKYHMRRTLANTSLTYEEMYTALTQIEGLLNSRPLYTTSEDELDPLTPAHFLVGHSYTSLPDPDLSHLKLSHLSRWQYIQRLRQEFWKQWHTSYLSTLQKRTKNKQSNLLEVKLNDIVLVHDKNLPPSNWVLGRIIELHPGDDKIIRVVTLKTANAILKRPVSKLSILPIY